MLQIDVKGMAESGLMKCNLYTADRCVQVFMTEVDYRLLMRDGFFIRDGKTKDSADVINTTDSYAKIRYDNGRPVIVAGQ